MIGMHVLKVFIDTKAQGRHCCLRGNLGVNADRIVPAFFEVWMFIASFHMKRGLAD